MSVISNTTVISNFAAIDEVDLLQKLLVTRQSGLGKAKNGNTKIHRGSRRYTEEKTTLFFKKLRESLCPSVNLCVN